MALCYCRSLHEMKKNEQNPIPKTSDTKSSQKNSRYMYCWLLLIVMLLAQYIAVLMD